MTNNKTTKRALLTSILALITCIVMLLGTTFAWFTDSVTSGNNIIKSGNLDVKMMWANGTEDVGSAVWKDASEGAIFNYKLWEPGYTEVRHVKISNEGSLALKYQLSIEANGAVSELADVIDVYYADPAVKVASRTELTDDMKLGTLTEVLAGLDTTGYGELKKGEKDTVTIALKMQESAGNDYMDLSIGTDFTVKLYATQLTAEEDSFDDLYDKDADFAEYYTVDSANFASVLSGLKDSEYETVVLNVTEDISWTTGAEHNSTPLLTEDVKNVKTVIINGNGRTLTATGSGVGPIRAANGGKLVFNDMTVVDNTVSYAEDAWEFTYLELGGILEFNNVSFTSGIMVGVGDDDDVNNAAFVDCTFNSSADSEYSVWVDSGTAAFTSCTFTGTRALKAHEDYGSAIDAITVDDCTFDNISKKPGVVLGTLDADTAVTIKDSRFILCQAGDQGMFIYETDTDVSTISFTNLNNSVVSSIVDVNDAESLVSALNASGSAGAGDSIINITSDIDLSGTDWTPVNVDGYHGADIITLNGNGNTITNLNAPLFAGGFAGGSGIVIKDLTIAESEIVSTNTIGSGAFIESIDSMNIITLDNCHLLNSTVTGGKGSRTGGLIGWTAGYSNVNDGPVKTYVTVTDCSVIGNTITCDGSVGGINGHAGNNDWTYTTIEDCIVKDNILTSTDDGGWRVGVVVGTANVGELTINNITESGNTLSQTGKTAPEGQSNLYGRFVPVSTGKLTIDGTEISA